MPWLVRFTAPVDKVSSTPSDLLDHHALLVSALWDLGTTGVVEQGAAVVAGFDHLDDARRAGLLAGGSGLTAAVEPVDEGWVSHDSVDVSIMTATGQKNVPIVAGPAFGHGGHPTTRLCLDLMTDVIGDLLAAGGADPIRLLDVGTGSGVLAIAAHHLGAAAVTACEIDPAAVEAARFNIDANGVDVDLVSGAVEDLPTGLDGGLGGFDVVVANLLVVAHERVAPAATAHLTPGGLLVTSGYLDSQVDRLVEAYRRHRPALEVVADAAADGWRALTLTEPPAGR